MGWLCGKEALYTESMSELTVSLLILFIGLLCGKEALYTESMSELSVYSVYRLVMW